LALDTRPNRNGRYIAAYLGKGEPSTRLYRGRTIANIKKPIRGHAYGGEEESARYDAAQGEIRGNAHMTRRFDMAKGLKAATPNPKAK